MDGSHASLVLDFVLTSHFFIKLFRISKGQYISEAKKSSSHLNQKNEQNYFLISTLAPKNGSNKK